MDRRRTRRHSIEAATGLKLIGRAVTPYVRTVEIACALSTVRFVSGEPDA